MPGAHMPWPKPSPDLRRQYACCARLFCSAVWTQAARCHCCPRTPEYATPAAARPAPCSRPPYGVHETPKAIRGGRACRCRRPLWVPCCRAAPAAPQHCTLLSRVARPPLGKQQCPRCGQQGRPKSAHRLSAVSRLRENTPAATLPAHTQDHRRTEQSSGGRSGLHGWRTLAKS